MKISLLMDKARETAEKAYAPYSKFRVGAAIQLQDGEIITGVNIENRSFGLTNCAERSAIFTAIGEGKKNITAIAVAGPDAKEPLTPCGACRQVISEFCSPETPIYYEDGQGGYIESSVSELYPKDSLQDWNHK